MSQQNLNMSHKAMKAHFASHENQACRVVVVIFQAFYVIIRIPAKMLFTF